MEFIWTKPGYLPEDAAMIRQKVFVEEQKFHNEFDETDENCYHLVLYVNGQAAGCARMYSGEIAGVYKLGRIAVLPEYRGEHLGSALMTQLEQKALELGGSRTMLDAQVRAQGFYESNGYSVCGELHYDEYCPHVMMEKYLQHKPNCFLGPAYKEAD